VEYQQARQARVYRANDLFGFCSQRQHRICGAKRVNGKIFCIVGQYDERWL
jgi:hypothetical protein